MSRKKYLKTEKICERIKFIRDQSGMNQSEFSKKVGIPQSSVSELESGVREPSSNTILKLILFSDNINARWLLTGEGSPFVKKESDRPKNNVVPLDRTPNHQHHRLINNFDNQPLAFEVNRALLHLEQNSPDDFRQVAGYVMGRSDAVKKTSPPKKAKNGPDSLPPGYQSRMKKRPGA
jgi:transcriptional regulator with XRE-family HTH domain